VNGTEEGVSAISETHVTSPEEETSLPWVRWSQFSPVMLKMNWIKLRCKSFNEKSPELSFSETPTKTPYYIPKNVRYMARCVHTNS
jgi:hypothetical protein